MNLTQIMSIVVSSKTKDWHHIPDGGREPIYRDQLAFYDKSDDQSCVLHPISHSDVAVYIHDVSITLAFGLQWMENFEEEWTKRFPDHKASGEYADVFYSGTLVYRDPYVVVDGGRTLLPLPPRQDKLEIPRTHAQFIRLLDSLGKMPTFDGDFRRAGMSLSDEPWPDFGTDRKESEKPRGLIQ